MTLKTLTMKKFYISFYLLLLPVFLFSQGLNFSSAEELAQINEPPSDYGFVADLPSSYSLERYVPLVKDQVGGTCVGFSTFYYALSTMYNIEFNITGGADKFAHSFDPYFIYSVVFNNKNDCDTGLTFPQAFNSAFNLGTKKLLYPPFTSCDTAWDEQKILSTIPYTKAYSINSYFTYKIENPNFIDNIKGAISYKLPVVVGMSYLPSMSTYNSNNQYGVDSDGLWTPKPNEGRDGGHALCVVGYDDYKFGGSFRIVNSWGSDFGDEGYMWVKYADFKTYTKEAYVMELNENVKSRISFKDGLNSDEYKRYGYKTDTNNLSTYEGQYLNDSTTGLGIWLDEDNDTHYIGEFNKGSMNGFFFILDEDGIFSAVAKDGVFTDVNKLGFGEGNDEIMEKQLSALKYFDIFGVELDGIRKANSTSSNLVQPSSND